MKDGKDIAVLTIGPIGIAAAEAIRQAEAERPGLSIAHYDMRFLKPLDERLLTEVAARYRKVITVEDGVRTGGFGSAILEWMADHDATTQVVRLGLPDTFVEHGPVSDLHRLCGIDVEGIKQHLTCSLDLWSLETSRTRQLT